MTSGLDIFRTASVLIREHGAGAALEAAQRAAALLERGDMDGCAVWKRIVGCRSGGTSGRGLARRN